MDSYFFLPGNKLHKIDYVRSLGVNKIIIDLEDAIKKSNLMAIHNNLIDEYEKFEDCIIRVSLDDTFDRNIRLIEELVEIGYKNFIIPKLKSKSEFYQYFEVLKNYDLKLILLIENTRFFLEIQDILSENIIQIKGIALGSYDFLFELGSKYMLKNLEYPRLHILYLANAYNLYSIDVASMNLMDEAKFKNELLDGFEKGYFAKFFIHPWQFKLSKTLSYFNEVDLKWALRLKEEFEKVKDINDFNAVIINGEIIEKIHLKKMNRILNYYKQ